MLNKKLIILRKTLHLALLGPFSIYWYLRFILSNEIYANYFIVTTLILFFIYEYIRLDLNKKIIFYTLVKEKEKNNPVDGLNLLISGILVSLLFEPRISILVILIAIIGDTVATLGGLYGKNKVFKESNNKTTYEGLILTFLVNLILSVIILKFIWISVIISLMAVIIESMVQKIDDNLVVPILTGYIAHILININ